MNKINHEKRDVSLSLSKGLRTYHTWRSKVNISILREPQDDVMTAKTRIRL